MYPSIQLEHVYIILLHVCCIIWTLNQIVASRNCLMFFHLLGIDEPGHNMRSEDSILHFESVKYLCNELQKSNLEQNKFIFIYFRYREYIFLFTQSLMKTKINWTDGRCSFEILDAKKVIDLSQTWFNIFKQVSVSSGHERQKKKTYNNTKSQVIISVILEASCLVIYQVTWFTLYIGSHRK